MPKPSNRGRKTSRLGSLVQEGELNTGPADWSTVPSELIHRCVIITTKLGGAVRFGYTRDGGAYSVGVYLDDDRETFYFRPVESFPDDFAGLVERLEGLLDLS